MGKKEKITITKETVRNARCYMPLADKYAWAEMAAEKCVVAYPPDEEEKAMSLSPLYKEDNVAKAVVYQNVLLSFYLGIEIGDDYDVETFDRYGEGQLLNTIERFKSDPELKDKIFDLLADYKETKKFIDNEVYQMKQRKNDPINRLLQNMAKVTSPENFREKGEEIQKLLQGIAESGEGEKGAK